MWLALSGLLASCDEPLSLGEDDAGQDAPDAAAQDSASGDLGGTARALDAGSRALSVRIEAAGGLDGGVLYVGCVEQCRAVRAVAEGGNPPYTFVWNDGVRGPQRSLCPARDATVRVTATDTAVEGEFMRAEQRASSELTTLAPDCQVDAGGADGGLPRGDLQPPDCRFEAVSTVAVQTFGEVAYFAGRQSLPAGRYRVRYVDGCLKYNWLFEWMLQLEPRTENGWWLVGDSPSQKLAKLPGSSQSFDRFEDCVAANLLEAPLEVAFDGGALGIWLDDGVYDDNLAGERARNPRWELRGLTACP